MILLLVALALWCLGFLLVARLRPRAWGDLTSPPPSLSVIIPARNEEHNLPALLRSINSQPIKPREVIVVDDGSTDHTADAARQLGATVLLSQPLPEGWRGKTWACHQGAQAAQGELLLFLDADTWFGLDGLDSVISAYPGGALSIGPYHVVRRAYEQLSLFFNLNMTLATLPQGLFGQMLLVDRESYWHVGGHESVRGRILENSWLAERFHEAGVPVHSVAGKGLLSFRMYPNGLRELIEGWTKGFASGAGRTPRATMLLLVAWIVGLMFPLLGVLLTGDWARWGVVYLLYAAQVAGISRRVGSFYWSSALFYPLPLMFFFILFAWSAARSGRRVSWKGREIRAD